MEPNNLTFQKWDHIPAKVSGDDIECLHFSTNEEVDFSRFHYVIVANFRDPWYKNREIHIIKISIVIHIL